MYAIDSQMIQQKGVCVYVCACVCVDAQWENKKQM